tara:strand:- start:76 stop:1125 length:1050 start_codon:yes stop_codon:yes gene_type:complete
MASGWTTSGIDWTSATTMRNSRTEDIVREIYLATHERDFWVQRWGRNLNFNYTLADNTRMETQLRFIYSTLSSWFTLDLNPVISGLYVPNQAVWIDEDNIPTGTALNNSVNLGVTHYDMAIGGNLETALSIDLGFLRDYSSNIPFRVNLFDLFKVYKILNFLTKCRAYQIEYDTGNFTYSIDLLNTGVGNGCGIVNNTHQSGRFNDDTAQEAYDNWVNSNPTDATNSYSSYFQVGNDAGAYRIQSNETYFKFLSMTGFNGSSFNSVDFNFNMLYSDNPTTQGSNPGLGVTNGINAMGNIQETIGAKAFPFPNTVMQSFPTGTGFVQWRNFGFILPFVDMNKEGFLKYYT